MGRKWLVIIAILTVAAGLAAIFLPARPAYDIAPFSGVNSLLVQGADPLEASAHDSQISSDTQEGPVITGLEPSSGPAGTGTRVTIKGIHFGDIQGSVSFYSGSGQPRIEGPIISWNDTAIVTMVPYGVSGGVADGASSGPVQVTTSGGTSNGYQFEVTFSYRGARWGGPLPQVHYRINPTLAGVSGAETAVQNAAQTWSDAGADFRFVYDGTTAATVPGYNRVNEIMWRPLGSGMLAATYSWWNGAHRMQEFDIVFNSNYIWNTTGSGEGFDIQSVATHELGHALGLEDLYGDTETPNDTDKVMYGNATSALKRSPDADDLAGIRWIYGSPTSPPVPSVAAGMGK